MRAAGVTCDPLWGVPVAVTTSGAAGMVCSSSATVQVVSDGTLAHEWSASNADDFGRNQVRFRVESRFDLMVTRAPGLVKPHLSAQRCHFQEFAQLKKPSIAHQGGKGL